MKFFISIALCSIILSREIIIPRSQVQILPPPPQNQCHLDLQRFSKVPKAKYLRYALLYPKNTAQNIRTAEKFFIY